MNKKQRRKRREKRINGFFTVVLLIMLALGLDWSELSEKVGSVTESPSWQMVLSAVDGLLEKDVLILSEDLSQLEFDGENQVILINGNQAEFTEEELSLEFGSWQTFSDLDTYNRVGVANGMLHQRLMPTEPREPLYVNPTGWKNRRVTIDGRNDWLFNRCHLIGFQLTGENNNLKNLMTGTRSLNTPHMLTFENKVAAYLRETNHHVRYRVTPIFRNNELVARGVQMEAQSVESDAINFNVFIFNVEAGMIIDYLDGSSKEAKK